MSLDFQTISIPFGKGIDTKTNEKLVSEGLLLSLENGIFKEGPTIRKRYGTTEVPGAILGSSSSITDGDGLATYNDEQILFGSETLYSRSDANDKFISKGSLTSVKVENETIFKNSYSQSQVDAATNSGITVWAWKDSRGGVRISVIDQETGAFLQNDVSISSTGDRPRCIGRGVFVFVFFRESSNLRWIRVPIGDPTTVSSATTVQSDLNSTNPNYDIIAIGQNMVCTYNTTAPDIKTFYLNASGVANPVTLPTAFTIAEAATNCIGIAKNAVDDIFVAYHNNTNGVRCFGRDLSFVAKFAPTTLDSDITNSFVNITGVLSSTATSSIRWWYQQSATDTWNTLTKHNTITFVGAAGSTAVFKRSVGLASKGFAYNSRSFVTLVHESPFQSTYFTAAEDGSIITRLLYGEAGGLRGVPTLPNCVEISTNVCLLPGIIKTKIIKEASETYTLTGVNKSTMTFEDDATFKGIQLGENLHVVGGMLFDYDGVNIVEHGFNLFPENTLVDTLRFQVVIAQQGTGVLPEISHVSFMHGDKIEGGQYWLITSAVPTDYYIWYRKDTVGTDPAVAGRTGLQVDILSTDNADSVATKTKTVLDAVGGAPFTTTRVNHTLIITNAANAAVTDAANGDMGLGGMTITVTTQGTGGAAEITTILCPAASLITTGEYFLLYSANDAKPYYFWFNKASGGGDPKVSGKTGIPLVIGSADSAATVAGVVNSAINALPEFTSTVATATVTVTNAANGVTTDAKNVNVGSATVGQIADGTYQYLVTYEWEDAKKQIHRSAPSVGIQAKVEGETNKGKVTLTIPTLRITAKTNVTINVYRTEANGVIPYKITSVSSPKFNDTTIDTVVFTDRLNDTAILSREILYTTGGVLENTPPPAVSIVKVHNNRLYCKTDRPNQIAYSREHTPTESVNFNADLVLTIDPGGDDITTFLGMDAALVIFKESQIRAIQGRGPNDAGLQNDFTDDQLVSSDVGCTEVNSLVLFDQGIMFKSKKGIYLLNRSFEVSYIGAPVEAYNSQTITSAVLVADQNEIRFTTETGPCLVYNYFFGQWSTFTNYSAVDAIIYDNEYYLLSADGTLRKEDQTVFTDSGAAVILRLETAWIKLSGLQGYKRVRRASFLGDYRSTHQLQVQIAYDYQDVISNTINWDPSTAINTSLYGSDSPYGSGTPYGGSGDNVYQLRVHMPRQKVQSVKYIIQDVMSASYGESYSISDLSLQVGILGGLNRMRDAKSA